jgi:FKBP-type peptidyl-prolyl cis-trans isomerase SlyD
MARKVRQKQESTGFQAGPGTITSLGYALFDAEGELVEQSAKDAPLVLLLGYGEAAPALEEAIQGLRVGDERDVLLEPEEAFGARDVEGIIEVDRSDLPPDLQMGDEFSADKDDGSGTVSLKVLEILDDVVVLDTNHPLAGQRVKLRIFVESVRPATAEELESAAARLAQAEIPAAGALLPAERLLRRGSGNRPQGDDPPPLPSGRVA